MIRKYAFLRAHQSQLRDLLVIIPRLLPEYAVAPSGDSLLLASVIDLRPLIVLVSWGKVYVALGEVSVELVLELVGVSSLDLAVSWEPDAQLIVVLQLLPFSSLAHLTDLGVREIDDSVVQISKEVYHVMLLQYVFLYTKKRCTYLAVGFLLEGVVEDVVDLIGPQAALVVPALQMAIN
jgi:hypothetical protein